MDAQPRRTATARAFRVEETTIADVHAAMRSGVLSCHALVQQYLRRIDAYDKRGPGINAIVIVNQDALRVADSLDAHFRHEGIGVEASPAMSSSSFLLSLSSLVSPELSVLRGSLLAVQHAAWRLLSVSG